MCLVFEFGTRFEVLFMYVGLVLDNHFILVKHLHFGIDSCKTNIKITGLVCFHYNLNYFTLNFIWIEFMKTWVYLWCYSNRKHKSWTSDWLLWFCGVTSQLSPLPSACYCPLRQLLFVYCLHTCDSRRATRTSIISSSHQINLPRRDKRST